MEVVSGQALLMFLSLVVLPPVLAWMYRAGYQRGRKDAEQEVAHRDGYFKRQAILEASLRGLQTTVGALATGQEALDTRFRDTLGSEEDWDVVEKLERGKVVQETGDDADSFFTRHGFQ